MWFAAVGAVVEIAAGWRGTEVREGRPSDIAWVGCGRSVGSAALLHWAMSGAVVWTHSAVVVQREAPV